MSTVPKKKFLFNSGLLLIIAAVFLSYAYSTGITGKTQKNGVGCDCHGLSPTQTVSVVINGPDQLLMNESAVYTVVISGGPLAAAGTNIAASAGVLAPGTGLRLDAASGELTHISPKAPAGGTVTFEFTYTAPAALGSETIFANGNSVNLNGFNTNDQWNFAQNKIINIVSTTGVEDEQLITSFKLNQNYPNPFNPSTVISWQMESKGYVNLRIFDALGSEVKTLVSEEMDKGIHSVNFDAAGLNSGVYYYTIRTGNFIETKKMLYLK